MMHHIIQNIIEKTNLSQQQAWWLVEFITNKKRALLFADNKELTPAEQKQLDIHIDEIAIDHKPLAYIIGFVPFLDIDLYVAPPTLIPRPETEEWVERLIVMIKKSNNENITILDIGTGSGCIALSLAQALPQAHVYAIDICPQALQLAQKNAKKNNLLNINFIQSDLFTHIPQGLKFDLIVSNPPYIDPVAQLEPSVNAWEDHGALFASNHGLDIIDQIIKTTPSYLKKNNELEHQLVIEIDSSQGTIVKKLLQSNNFKNIVIQQDQFDRDRTAWAKL